MIIVCVSPYMPISYSFTSRSETRVSSTQINRQVPCSFMIMLVG